MSFFKQPSPPRFHRSCTKTGHKTNPSKRYVACELEIASVEDGADIERVVRKWAGGIVEDGSLPDSGFEITTAPANGDKFCQQIDDICAELSDANAKVTKECGYHVHIDARDFNHWDMRRLVMVYAKIEDALFGMVPEARRSNRYCSPCGGAYLASIDNEPTKAKKAVIDATYPCLKGMAGKELKSSLDGKRRNKYSPERYNALNLHSWFYRGTVECRLAYGSANAEKIKLWAILWAGILDYAYKASEAEIKKLPADSLECLLAIAPTEETKAFIRERTAKFAH